MNTLENKIQIDLVWAMKNKNASKVSALRSIKTAIMETKTAANGKKELEDNDIIKIIHKNGMSLFYIIYLGEYPFY